MGVCKGCLLARVCTLYWDFEYDTGRYLNIVLFVLIRNNRFSANKCLCACDYLFVEICWDIKCASGSLDGAFSFVLFIEDQGG